MVLELQQGSVSGSDGDSRKCRSSNRCWSCVWGCRRAAGFIFRIQVIHYTFQNSSVGDALEQGLVEGAIGLVTGAILGGGIGCINNSKKDIVHGLGIHCITHNWKYSLTTVKWSFNEVRDTLPNFLNMEILRDWVEEMYILPRLLERQGYQLHTILQMAELLGSGLQPLCRQGQIIDRLGSPREIIFHQNLPHYKQEHCHGTDLSQYTRYRVEIYSKFNNLLWLLHLINGMRSSISF